MDASLINFVCGLAEIIKIPWVAWKLFKQVIINNCSSLLCGKIAIMNFLDCWSWTYECSVHSFCGCGALAETLYIKYS